MTPATTRRRSALRSAVCAALKRQSLDSILDGGTCGRPEIENARASGVKRGVRRGCQSTTDKCWMTESGGIQVAFPPRTLQAHWHTLGLRGFGQPEDPYYGKGLSLQFTI